MFLDLLDDKQITNLGIQFLDSLEDIRYPKSLKEDARSCVFCRKVPKEKNLEDVVPMWLVDPKRRINDGDEYPHVVKFSEDAKIDIRQFKVPACVSCNSSYGKKLEDKVAEIFYKLKKRERLIEHECIDLLDWFDKVRYGYALASTRRFGNPYGLKPNFHIDNRIAQKDRALIIHRGPKTLKGIDLSEPNEPLFLFHPTHITLRVNDLLFTSLSEIGLCTETLGIAKVNLKDPSKAVKSGVNCTLSPMRSPPAASNFPAKSNYCSILLQSISNKYQMPVRQSDSILHNPRVVTRCFVIKGKNIGKVLANGVQLIPSRIDNSLLFNQLKELNKKLDEIAIKHLRADHPELKKAHIILGNNYRRLWGPTFNA